MTKEQEEQAISYLQYFVSWLSIRNYRGFENLMVQECREFLKSLSQERA